jgi:hypothetical protein
LSLARRVFYGPQNTLAPLGQAAPKAVDLSGLRRDNAGSLVARYAAGIATITNYDGASSAAELDSSATSGDAGFGMRYSLLTLNLVVAIAAVSVASFVRHGSLGFAFVLPHLVVLLAVPMLIRRNRPMLASMVTIAYLACWAVTAIYGSRSVTDQYRRQIVERFAHRDLKSLGWDPMYVDFGRKPAAPWYFVGNESSPCPFLVSVDIAVHDGVFGVGETCYCVWCLGPVWTIRSRLNWNSG